MRAPGSRSRDCKPFPPWARYSSPGRGVVINVVGPDGSGKTTLVTAIAEWPRHELPVRVVANRAGAHRRPGVLPHRRLRGSTTEPHRHAPHPRWISWAKALYLLGDFLLGWLFYIRPYVRQGGWVVVERGWSDMVVDPLRYRMDPRTVLPRVLARLLPRPDVFVVLEAPAGVIRSRKAQLEVDELERQARAWRAVRLPGPRPTYLDSTRPVEQLLGDVIALCQSSTRGAREQPSA